MTVSEVGTFGEKQVTILEAIPPNSFHVTVEQTAFSHGSITVPSIAAESVTLNGQTRSRTKRDGEPWGPWECPKARPPVDSRPASIQRTVEASRGPDTAIEGTPVRTYVYTTTFPDNKQDWMKSTLYVDTQTGLPRREVIVVNVGPTYQLSSTQDYYDYDAKIDITLPPCEKEI